MGVYKTTFYVPAASGGVAICCNSPKNASPKLPKRGWGMLIFTIYLVYFAWSQDTPEPPVIEAVSYYGVYDASRKETGVVAASLEKDPPDKPRHYQFIPEATRVWRIGVLFPTTADSYWTSVSDGLYQEAKRLGVYMEIKDAGGYEYLGRQKSQFEAMMGRNDDDDDTNNIDGIILASISYTGLDTLVEKAWKKGLPVVEIVNDIYAADIQGKAMVSFLEMGQKVGAYLTSHPQAKDEITVAFFPGPLDSGWAVDSLRGFLMEMHNYHGHYRMLSPSWGDTQPAVQHQLILDVLEKNYQLDYIIGNAVAANEATKILSEMGREEMVTVISTYLTLDIYPKLLMGKIQAAPCDQMTEQARIGMDMMVQILEGEKDREEIPFRVGPKIPVITSTNVKDFPKESLFGHAKIPYFGYDPSRQSDDSRGKNAHP